MKPSWYFTCLGAVWKRPFKFSTPSLVDPGVFVGNHFLRDHGVEHGVLLDQVLEHGPQFFRRELLANGFEILACRTVKLSDATALVERHQDALHQHLLGGRAGHVERLAGQSRINARTAVANPDVPNHASDDPINRSNGDGIEVSPTPCSQGTDPSRGGLSDKDASAATVPADPDHIDVVGRSSLRQGCEITGPYFPRVPAP